MLYYVLTELFFVKKRFPVYLSAKEITLNHQQNNSTHSIYYKWANIASVLSIYGIF